MPTLALAETATDKARKNVFIVERARSIRYFFLRLPDEQPDRRALASRDPTRTSSARIQSHGCPDAQRARSHFQHDREAAQAFLSSNAPHRRRQSCVLNDLRGDSRLPSTADAAFRRDRSPRARNGFRTPLPKHARCEKYA